MKNGKSSYINFTFLISVLAEKFFRIRSLQVLVGVIMLLLFGVILLLGWLYSQKVKEIVTRDFNEQQLVLARHAAQQVESSLNMLKRELQLLGNSPSVQYMETAFMARRMGITFSSVKDEGVEEIRFIESNKKTHVVNSSGYHTIYTSSKDLSYLEWARNKKIRNNIVIKDISLITPLVKKDTGASLVMKMVLPIWQVSVDESHPLATNNFSGVLIFTVDATSLVKVITKDIRSGKTGYAWVIDNKGNFLYHPESEFIGKNAFEVRKEKKPTISFAKINEIQKEQMLKGKGGTSFYTSGWHRGVEGEMKKLIAYAPITLDSKGADIWSVAVVAPISEVEGAIYSIHVRQLSFQVIVIFVILFGGILNIALVLSWSNSLKDEVRKKTMDLEKSEHRYKSLVENAEDIIFTVDHNGNIMTINHSGSTFFNHEAYKLTGVNIGELCLNEDSAALQLKTIDEVFASGKSKQITYSVEVDGNPRWLSTNFTLLLDEHGNPSNVLGISRDISDRKKIEEQSYYTEKLASVGTLAAGVAHEINNPLAIILGFTDLQLEKTQPDSELYEILKTIEKQGTNAKRVVENLLSFTRFSEQKEENVDINQNINSVLSVVGNTASLHKITINKKLPDSLPQVKGHAGELQQVFFNIINNAISAMKTGGTLSVITKPADNGDEVEVVISDTGYGIDRQHRAKIFDPLFTTKKVGEGTGLGLFVSYGIITKHGGTITFETSTEEESTEHGTTFTITLPTTKQ